MPRTAIGVDIEEIARFRTLAQNPQFLKRILTSEELNYFRSRNSSLQTLAGIYAAKEAAVKALFQIFHSSFSLEDIEIVHDRFGVPTVRLAQRTARRLRKKSQIVVSISHTNEIAMAVAMAKSNIGYPKRA